VTRTLPMQKRLLKIFLVCVPLIASSQDKNSWHRSALGAHFFVDQFRLIDSVSKTGKYKHLNPGLAISYMTGLSPHYDINVTLSGSFVDFPKKSGGTLGNGRNNLLVETDAALHYKIFQGNRAVSPNLQAGIGFSEYNGNLGLYAPVGAGVEIKILEEAFLLTNIQYRFGVTNNQDNHFYFSVGIAGILQKNKKKKPLMVAGVPSRPPLVDRNIDSDGDGIPDSVDACPLVKGLIRYNGCPIPDSDGDGINDEEDSCPHVAGFAKYHGCPVPDRDGDGINDEDDKCPDVPGVSSNHGCPEIKKAVLATIDLAAKNIFFNTNKYEILPKSFPGLDSVVAILKADTLLILDISGHTDYVGGRDKNQLLSENRARAVLRYFTQKDIKVDRLRARGFGLTKPIAENTTARGRAQNRRVEIKPYYH
jgi:OOP family OmpA-OmpF porin